MHLSIREVLQLAERCFYVAGFDQGPARANAETVWWMEAYRGTGLSTLHGLLDDLDEFDRSCLSIDEDGAEISVVDSGAQPSIVSANPTVDLSCSLAEQNGLGIACTSTAAGDDTLDALGHQAYRAGKRGYVALTLYADEKGSGTILGVPEEPYPTVVEKTLDEPSVTQTEITKIVDAGLHQRRQSPLVQSLLTTAVDEQLAAEEHLLTMLLRSSLEASSRSELDDESGFVTICIDPDHPRYAGGAQNTAEEFLETRETEFTETFHPSTVGPRVEKLLNDGVEIEEPVWRDIFEYSSDILAPEFEGSYRGAGFDINE
ncbi:hypothetical protein [Halobellus ordinarius]|uniref:hypothetical protein n=1 Tax=Halobellus ordinarius TaxID=3075120 RepID=UPI0028803474|nr:hypothetical protein [Halobellus sp. ZY16]